VAGARHAARAPGGPEGAAVVGEVEGQAFIAMEPVEGPSLAGKLAAGPLPPEQALHYREQVAEAFEPAHARGVSAERRRVESVHGRGL